MQVACLWPRQSHLCRAHLDLHALRMSAEVPPGASLHSTPLQEHVALRTRRYLLVTSEQEIVEDNLTLIRHLTR